MKKLLPLLLLAACSNTPPPKQLTFLVAGQSNGVSLRRTDGPTFSTTGRVTINNYAAGDFTSELFTPTAIRPAPASTVWVKLGDLLPYNTTFYNVAVGGTSVQLWAASLHYRILTAPCPNAIIWVQGETDNYEGMSEADYYAYLVGIIQKTNLPWFIALTSDGPVGNPIRQAQLRIIADGYARLGADLDTLRIPENMDEPHLHFIGIGADRAAQLWHTILKDGI